MACQYYPFVKGRLQWPTKLKKCNVLIYFEAIYHFVKVRFFSSVLSNALYLIMKWNSLLSECKWSWTHLQAISQAAHHNDSKIITFASPNHICCSFVLITAHTSTLVLPLHHFCCLFDVIRLYLNGSLYSGWKNCNAMLVFWPSVSFSLSIPRGSSCIMD